MEDLAVSIIFTLSDQGLIHSGDSIIWSKHKVVIIKCRIFIREICIDIFT